MSRNTSLKFREAVYGPETDEVPLILIEISEPSLPIPIRVTSDSVDTVHMGNVYVSYNFDIHLPDDSDDMSPSAVITIDNVGRELTEAIRNLQTPPSVRVLVVLASQPDVVEAEFDDFKLTNVYYDQLVVQGTIGIEDFMSEPFSGDSFVPSTFPGLF